MDAFFITLISYCISVWENINTRTDVFMSSCVDLFRQIYESSKHFAESTLALEARKSGNLRESRCGHHVLSSYSFNAATHTHIRTVCVFFFFHLPFN